MDYDCAERHQLIERLRCTLIQMSGEAFYGIDLPGSFVKLVYDISEKTAAGSEHAISYVSSKLSVRFGKLF